MQRNYADVTEVALDRTNGTLVLVTEGRRVVVSGVERLFINSIAWSESMGAIRLDHGRVSVNGAIAGAEDSSIEVPGERSMDGDDDSGDSA